MNSAIHARLRALSIAILGAPVDFQKLNWTYAGLHQGSSQRDRFSHAIATRGDTVVDRVVREKGIIRAGSDEQLLDIYKRWIRDYCARV